MEFLRFAILGLGAGAIYALLGQGMVLIYSGSGIVNFAHGAYAMAGSYIFYELHDNEHQSFAIAFVLAVLAIAGIGALTHLLIMRPLRHAAPLSRLIGTLAVLGLLTAIATIIYGGNLTYVPSSLPTDPVSIFGAVVSEDRLIMLGIAMAITAILALTARYSRMGLGTSAVAENPLAASALGWSPNLIASATWALGGALAAIAGILLVPLTGLSVSNLTLIVIAAMAAAMLSGFESFVLTLTAGIIIGAAQSEMTFYVTTPGLSASLPFIVIMAVLVLRGKALPLRGHVADRLPKLGNGVPQPRAIGVVVVVMIILMLTVFSTGLDTALAIQAAAGVIILSVVVLTGYAGQLSLAQFALAGAGAYIAGRLVATEQWGFVPALAAGVVGAGCVGAIVGIPALRTRGVNLAVVTLGLAFAAQQIVFDNEAVTGNTVGTPVGAAHLFGLNVDPIAYPARYGVMCVLLFAFVAIGIANLRRSRVGRRLLAIRSNERSAASVGINVVEGKLFAFALASAVAGLGGVLLAFEGHYIDYTMFDPITSINFVAYTVIGGVGHVTGALVGSGFYNGGVPSFALDQFGSVNNWLVLAGSVGLVVVLLQHPDGIAARVHQHRIFRWIGRKLHILFTFDGLRSLLVAPLQTIAVESANGNDGASLTRLTSTRPVQSAVLEIEHLSARYGGVAALSDVSLSVSPGEVVGLIGPNGAGKTTLLDCISGFVRASSGSVRLGGRPIDRLPPYARARAGIGRSFQSLELFDDLTVRENLVLAGEPRDQAGYTSAVFKPGQLRLSAAASAAIDAFGLQGSLDRSPGDLPYGRRRLVGMARSIASAPAVLCLDEPAAGLGDDERAELSSIIASLATSWNLGILLVEHNVGLVMGVCDRIVCIDFGSVIASGTPSEIRSHERVISAYLGSTVAVGDEGDPLAVEGEVGASEGSRLR